MPVNTAHHEPASIVAHNLVNKLSAIVGFCDLLYEKIEKDADPESAKQIGLIHDLAKSAAQELIEHQSEL